MKRNRLIIFRLLLLTVVLMIVVTVTVPYEAAAGEWIDGTYGEGDRFGAPNLSTLTVNTTDDELNSDGDCSLREAIQAGNTDSAVDACPAGSGDDIITLPAGTYTLSLAGANEENNQTGDLDITSNLTINGVDAESTIIDGNQQDRVLHVHSGYTVAINDLKITNGNSSKYGGGIFSEGILTISDSTISNNSTRYGGGGIRNNSGTLNINNSIISNNSSQWAGGGINNKDTLTINNSTISHNSAGNSGGGIANSHQLTINNSTISDNSAQQGGGGINNSHTFSINSSTIRHNSAQYGGGGIQQKVNSSSITTINNSTISGNRANYHGGGIAISAYEVDKGAASMTINNSTISDNTAAYDGGGIGTFIKYPEEASALSHVKNTIIANNIGDSSASDCDSSLLNSYGYNLIQHAGNCTINEVENSGTNITGQDPLLAALADHGGQTETHALLDGSPAIDAGSCTDIDGNTVSSDQRGVSRPQFTTCDIGAFEKEGIPDIAVSPDSFEVRLEEGQQSDYEYLVVRSVGTSDLEWHVSHSAAWLDMHLNPIPYKTPPGSSLTLGFNVDASGLSAGTYTETLTITSNDPDQPSIQVPVSLVVSPHIPVTKLLANDGVAGQRFGSSVSISSDVAIIAAPAPFLPSGSGATYIYRWDGSQWQQESKLPVGDGTSNSSVSIDGDVAIVSTYQFEKATYIYRWDGSQWQQESKLSTWAFSVSIDGDVALVGDNIYRWDGSQWQEESKLIEGSVSIDGDVVLVGNSYHDDNGAAYVYRWDGSQWQEESKLLPSDGASGFGRSVSIDGDVALVGGKNSAYIYRWNGSQWQQESRLLPSDEATLFGMSVSIDGDVALVGSRGDAAYMYRWDGSQWQQESKLLPSDGASGFGFSVSIDSNVAFVGADLDNDKGWQSGSVYVYDLSTNEPDIALSPDSFEVALEEGESSSETLVISNTGNETLTFDLSEQASSSDVWDVLDFPAEKVEPGLADEIQTLGEDDFLIYLSEQADLSQAYTISDWQARGEYVRQTLWNTAQESQADLRAFLDSEVQNGNISGYQSFYLVNAIQVSGTFATLDSLALRDDIAYIEGVKEFTIPEPEVVSGDSINSVEWGVSKIRADQVWNDLDVRGSGIVVANIDTGVLSSHTTLVNQYRGTATGSHDYNWFDPTNTYATAPGDNHGHGTHVMGTMVGSDGGSNQIGVAPGAQWIAAKGCSSSSCTSTDLLAAAQWVLAPYPIGGTPEDGNASKRPHVVNNSWGGSGGRLLYQASVNAWRAADIFPAFSAGNSGPNAGTIGSPGDYAESFASGATDSTDSIASFSSRGPSSLTDETKPDVSAPGVSIRSASNNGGYQYMNGTSMASPHVAGCVALIKAAKTSLDVSTIETLLINTATDLGSSGPDDAYGHGRIDCYEAIASLNRSPDVPWLTLNPTTGSLEPDNSQNINVAVDSTGLAAGTYRANIGISSNDPDEPSIDVPVTLVVGSSAPTASFSASTVAGDAPLTVPFIDESTGAITSWTWEFGDGNISGARYPEHTYTLPGTYTVSLTVSGPGGEDSETKKAYITVNEPDEATTLILTNRKKVEALHGTFAATQLMSKLGDFAAHEQVQGLVIALENEANVASAYAEWDADPTSTEKANAVTSAIKEVIDAKFTNYPDLEYIVVAGDDRVIPFRRVRDKSWYSEKHYCNDVSSDSVTGAALCDNMTLTDDYYAHRASLVPRNSNWDGQPLYMPYFAIGRLIETPTEMIAQIDTFLEDSRIPASDAVVTGYTFVTDAAQKNCNVLKKAGVNTDCDLIGEDWNKSDFIDHAFNGSPELVSINGHADHYRFGAPIGSPLTSDEIASASGINQRAIFYTIGCHSGLNVSPKNDYPLDTAQAFAQQQANYVANTGYGYGYRYSVGLSEQLMIDFSNQLTRYGTITLGEALTTAKQKYYLRSYRFGYHDEKILIESTLYGLPMYEVTSGLAQRAASDALSEEDALPEGVVLEETPIPLDGAFSKSQLSFQLPELTKETTDDGSYYSLDELVHSEHGEPMQPKLPFEVSVPGTNAHGLVFKGGSYSDINNFDPVIAEAVTLTLPSTASALAEPTFTATNWYPAIPSQLNILDNGANAQLTTLLGQYNSEEEGGTERLYNKIEFDIYYHAGSDDWTAPTITSVSSELAAGSATVTVDASDESGIHDVLVTYSDNQNGTWQSISLSDNGDAWSGSFSATESTDFFVQVVDKAGNVSVDDNDGAYYQPTNESGGEETEIEIALVAGWNLISLPLQPNSTAIADVLASIEGNYTLVQAYDGCDTLDPWKKFDPNPPAFSQPNDLTELDQTIGFWIKMTSPATLDITGRQTATTIPLCEGWNMVAYPAAEEQAIGDALSSLAGTYTLVNQYKAADTNDPWKKFDPNPPAFSAPNDLTVMSPGFGYWIQIEQAIEWVVGD